MTTAHSPLPWRFATRFAPDTINDSEGERVCEVYQNEARFGREESFDFTENNATLVVRSVNAFGPMREALEKAQAYLWKNSQGCTCQVSAWDCEHCHALNEIQSALALASGTGEEMK